MKKLFIPLIALGLLASCETVVESSNEGTDTEKTMDDHDGHDHSEMSGPAMPSVPDGSRIYFGNLKDGDAVTSPVAIVFGAEGIGVQPAGEIKEGYGHHHIIINDSATPMGEAVPADDTHIHYGGGQKGDTLDLPVGIHTLVLQFADGMHRSYGEELSAKVKIKVIE